MAGAEETARGDSMIVTKDRPGERRVIYVSGCRGSCSGPICYCVENLKRTIAENRGAEVKFLPDDDPIFRTMPAVEGV